MTAVKSPKPAGTLYVRAVPGRMTMCLSGMGVPVVSLVGRFSLGRAGLSLLSNVGLPELAVDSTEAAGMSAMLRGRARRGGRWDQTSASSDSPAACRATSARALEIVASRERAHTTRRTTAV